MGERIGKKIEFLPSPLLCARSIRGEVGARAAERRTQTSQTGPAGRQSVSPSPSPSFSEGRDMKGAQFILPFCTVTPSFPYRLKRTSCPPPPFI